MDKPTNPLSKTCNSCGILKPLSAFLQLSDKDNATYGVICSDCRQTNKGNNLNAKEGDESSRTNLTLTIDAKVRAQYEVDQHEHHEQVEEDYYKEREEDELQKTKQLEKNDRLVKDEKKIRSGLFGKTPPNANVKTNTQIINQQQTNQKSQNIEQVTKQETAARDEQKEKEIDLTAPVEDTRFGKKEKHKGTAFQHFSYAHSSVIGKAFSNTSTPTNPAQTNKETPSEFIEKTWGPGSKRR